MTVQIPRIWGGNEGLIAMRVMSSEIIKLSTRGENDGHIFF